MRQLWLDIMHYRSFDRMPVIHWTEWPETLERWIGEGMPRGVDVAGYFGADLRWANVGANLHLYPVFEEQTFEETSEYRIYRGGDGVVQKEWKHASCIPQFLDFTFKSARDWDQYKWRLQPDSARLGSDFDQRIAEAESSGLPIRINAGSMMGWLRNWMGVENMSYLLFDDPDVCADIVDTFADLVCWNIDQTAARMKSRIDLGFGWEDIAGRAGPLVSPERFRRCIARGYRKVRAKLESHGITLLGLDSDGNIEPLIGEWMDAGVNLFFPIEIGVWHADPLALRRKFGRELRMIGGFEKGEIEKGPAAIDAEIERRLPLMKEGGYIVLPDHIIAPGTPLEYYKYYLERIGTLRF